MDWRREIVDLHEFFEGFFRAEIESIDRLETVLDENFTMIGPNGTFSDRSEVIDAVRSGHGHSSSISIAISDAELVAERSDMVVVRYIETHDMGEASNRRITTAVFVDRADRPNGVAWLHAQETWLDRETR